MAMAEKLKSSEIDNHTKAKVAFEVYKANPKNLKKMTGRKSLNLSSPFLTLTQLHQSCKASRKSRTSLIRANKSTRNLWMLRWRESWD